MVTSGNGSVQLTQCASILPRTAVKFQTAGCRMSISFFATVKHAPAAPKGSAARVLSSAVSAFSAQIQENRKRDGMVVSRIRSAGLSKLVNEQDGELSSSRSIEAPGVRKTRDHTAPDLGRTGTEQNSQYSA